MAPNRAFSTDHRWPEAAGFSSPLVDFLDLLQHGVGAEHLSADLTAEEDMLLVLPDGGDEVSPVSHW